MNLEQYIKQHISQIEENYHTIILKEDLNYKAFYISCIVEYDVAMIDKIINETKINVNKKLLNYDNGFTIACRFNSNLNVIKHLAENLKINVHCRNFLGENAFSGASFSMIIQTF